MIESREVNLEINTKSTAERPEDETTEPGFENKNILPLWQRISSGIRDALTAQPNASDSQPQDFSRREFLKQIAAGTAVMTLTPYEQIFRDHENPQARNRLHESPATNKETLSSPQARQLIIDIAPIFNQDVIDYQQHSPSDLIADYTAEQGGLLAKTLEETQTTWDSLSPEKQQLLSNALSEFESRYSRHAIDVIDAATTVAEQDLGLENNYYELWPLQNTLSLTDPEYTDELGNEGLLIKFDANQLIAVANNADQTVMSISSQLGVMKIIEEKRVKAFDLNMLNMHPLEPIDISGERFYILAEPNVMYLLKEASANESSQSEPTIIRQNNVIEMEIRTDGNQTKLINAASNEEIPILTVSEAETYYRELLAENLTIVDLEETAERLILPFDIDNEFRLENLKAVLELARACPDKLWIFSAGNKYEDFNSLRELATSEDIIWPENILFIAQLSQSNENSPTPTHLVWGADIYVDNSEFNIDKDGSSFSAPIISTIAQELADQGLSPIEIKEKLVSYTEVEMVHGNTKRMTTEKITRGFSTSIENYFHTYPTFTLERLPIFSKKRARELLQTDVR